LIQQVQQQISDVQEVTRNLITSGAFGDFALFAALPVELRHEIWEVTLPGPRILEIMFVVEPDQNIPRLLVKGSTPSALLVCKESRSVALKRFTAVLAVSKNHERQFRFDPSEDTVFLTHKLKIDDRVEELWRLNYYQKFNETLLEQSSMDDIQHLAVDEISLAAYGYWGTGLLSLNMFQNLRDITIIGHNNDFEMVYGDDGSCSDSWESDGELTFVNTVNHARMAYDSSLIRREIKEISRNPDSSVPRCREGIEILTKLPMRDGKLCCDSEGIAIEDWRDLDD
jgi:hypothetical protein